MDARRVLQDAPYAIHYCTMPRYSKRGLNGSATKSRKSFMKRDGPLAARSHTRFILRRYSLLSPSLFSTSFLFLCLTFLFLLRSSLAWRILANCFLFDPFSSLPFSSSSRSWTRAPETERISHVPKSTRLRPPCTPRCLFL